LERQQVVKGQEVVLRCHPTRPFKWGYLVLLLQTNHRKLWGVAGTSQKLVQGDRQDHAWEEVVQNQGGTLGWVEIQ
jgi:hypothetical protein